MKKTDKVRFAVVGQGWFAQAAILPAFQHADNAVLSAIVSGDPVKRDELGKKYSVPAYPYEEYDALCGRGEIDAVYIVLPNSTHADYTIRAARAGVHVLCEKPMAANSKECQAMIDACDKGGVKLMIAYRLHFEEGNLEAIEVVHSGEIGEPRAFSSLNCQQVMMGNTRLDADLAGSPLMDIGVYCINASRYLFRADPTEVVAFSTTSADPRFREVPEMVSAVMQFPGAKVGSFTCGFGEAKASKYQVLGTKGDVQMDPAFPFESELKMTVTVGDKAKERTFKKRDHIAPELMYFSHCIRSGQRPEPDGYEGLADLRIIEAIQESMASGKAVKLAPFPEKPRPGKDQQLTSPAVAKQDLVNAKSPGEA